jgi:hypothetical protein
MKPYQAYEISLNLSYENHQNLHPFNAQNHLLSVSLLDFPLEETHDFYKICTEILSYLFNQSFLYLILKNLKQLIQWKITCIMSQI